MKQNKLLLLVLFCSCVLLSNSLNAQLMAVESKDTLNGKPKVTARLIGRLKLNGIYDIKGSLAGNSSFLIHKNDVSGLDIPSFSMDMRQSQLRFVSTIQLNNGKELKSMLEADFEGANNTSQFRLRHAYVQYNHWTVGQTWSNFGDSSLWPSPLLDWDGPTGMVLSRRIQVRYTGLFKENGHTSFMLSAEYMEPRRLYDYTLSPTHGVDYAPSRAPDAVAGIRYAFDNGGFMKLSGLYRSIAYDSEDIAAGKTEFEFDSQSGGGVTAMTSIFFRKKSGLVNNLQAQWTIGKGISDYFLAVGGSGLDGFARSDFSGKLDLLPVHAGFISYERFFNKKFHSMVMASYNHFYDGAGTLAGWDRMTNYQFTLNASYDFFDFLTIALEPQIGYKQLQYADGSTQGANAVRINFGMLFNF
ncbi:DcaP family trimeric outer membrane transporter [Flavobacterium sp. PL02]|uniref:DcaP family trimeric outer membrane transporter n=1 Tax=Flavobacterium sp. PL02 TaxID=3088354 RepID=UPI002B23792E|nr:DcaP family trimeric outer membrane transporter [Flavobacterium sp. PL02]MEA9414015.1 DcaP family trimeric outer membrane transporter [Flavobacterium sp. PL02]